MDNADGHRFRVLLVEDEFLICDDDGRSADRARFRGSLPRRMPQDALAHLTCGAPCDVLFTDINLGRASTARRWRGCARELRPDLPVVYASGRWAGSSSSQAVPGCERSCPSPTVRRDVCAMLSVIAASTRRLIAALRGAT